MNGPEGLIQSPEDVTAPGALRIDRLSAFLRRFPLRVTALRGAAGLDGPPAQFALAGEGKLDPIEDDGLSIQLKLDAIEAQAPKALLATPQRRCGPGSGAGSGSGSGSGLGLGVHEAPTTPHRGTPLG